MKLQQFLISFFILTSSSLFAEFRCLKPGKITHVFNNKQIVQNKNFCIDHNDYKIISFDCIKSKGCSATDAYKNSPKLHYHSEIGSPYHHKCYLLGGNPRLISYFDGENWHDTGICEFKDSSFISLFNSLAENP